MYNAKGSVSSSPGHRNSGILKILPRHVTAPAQARAAENFSICGAFRRIFIVKIASAEGAPRQLISEVCAAIACSRLASDGRSHAAQGALLAAALGSGAQHALRPCAAGTRVRLVPPPRSGGLDQPDQHRHDAWSRRVQNARAQRAAPPAPRSGAFSKILTSQGRHLERFS